MHNKVKAKFFKFFLHIFEKLILNGCCLFSRQELSLCFSLEGQRQCSLWAKLTTKYFLHSFDHHSENPHHKAPLRVLIFTKCHVQLQAGILQDMGKF